MNGKVRSNVFTNSTSKQKWSFSKSRRFLDFKPKYQASFYNNPSSLEKRSTSLGFGQRANPAGNPKEKGDPGEYNIPSQFQNKNSKGFSFGAGRDQTKFQNYLRMFGALNTTTIYKVDDSFFHKGQAFSITQRTPYPPNYFLPNDPELQRLSKMPGPTSYETIDSIGEKCVTSKQKNIGYRFSRGQRLKKMKTLQVGPGSYDDKTIRPDGQYVLSNMKGSGRRTIFKGVRKSMFEKSDRIPGPGEYDIVGDFGEFIKKEEIKDISKSMNIGGKVNLRPKTARN